MKLKKWILQPGKYLVKEEASKLMSVAKNRAVLARMRGKKIPIRDYFIIHLALATGLRVMEIAALKCGDLFLGNEVCSLWVRNGKGGKERVVYFSSAFKKHCKEYLSWKRQIGEPVKPDSPLIISSNTGSHMTTRAIEKVFKRCAEKACLYSTYSIHSLRHTHACRLLEVSGNIRLVQKQLGHSNVKTTEAYADVMLPERVSAANKLGW